MVHFCMQGKYMYIYIYNNNKLREKSHFSGLVKFNCSGLWEFKVGLSGHGLADSSTVLCIDPCTTMGRIISDDATLLKI